MSIENIVAIVIGSPILAGCAIAITAIIRSWALKSRELRLKEREIQMEEKLRTDELNARILRSDDFPLEQLSRLEEELRQLRAEVTQIKQDVNNRPLS